VERLVELHEVVDRAEPCLTALGYEGGEAFACRQRLQIGDQLAREDRFVDERELLGVFLDEEVERVDDRHLGHQFNLDPAPRR
jgi:hypothetical protein